MKKIVFLFCVLFSAGTQTGAQEIKLAVQKNLYANDMQFLSISADNRFLAIRSVWTGDLDIYDPQKGFFLWSLPLEKFKGEGFFFTPDNKYLIIADKRFIYIVDIISARFVHQITSDRDIYWNSTGSRFAFYRPEGSACGPLSDNADPVFNRQLALQKEGSLIVIEFSGEHAAIIRELDPNISVSAPKDDKEETQIEIIGLAVSSANELAIISSQNYDTEHATYADLFDLNNGRLIQNYQLPNFGVLYKTFFSPKNRYLVVLGQDYLSNNYNNVLIDLEAGAISNRASQQLKKLHPLMGYVVFSADDNTLLTIEIDTKLQHTNYKSTISLLHLPANKVLSVFTVPAYLDSRLYTLNPGLTQLAYYEYDYTNLQSGSKLKVVRLDNGKTAAELFGMAGAFIYSRDGKYLIHVNSSDKSLDYTDAVTFRVKKQNKSASTIFQGLLYKTGYPAIYMNLNNKLFSLSPDRGFSFNLLPADSVMAFDISDNGGTLVRSWFSSNNRNYVSIDSLLTGKPYRRIELNEDHANGCWLSPGNKYAAIRSSYTNAESKTRMGIAIYDVGQGRQTGVIPGHWINYNAPVYWSKDSRFLILVRQYEGMEETIAFDSKRSKRWVNNDFILKFNSQHSIQKIVAETGKVTRSIPLYGIKQYVQSPSRSYLAVLMEDSPTSSEVVILDDDLNIVNQSDTFTNQVVHLIAFLSEDQLLLLTSSEFARQTRYEIQLLSRQSGKVMDRFSVPEDIAQSLQDDISQVYSGQSSRAVIGNYIVGGAKDGHLFVFDVVKKEKAFEIILRSPGGYMILLPDGYYMATKNVIDEVRFTKNNSSLPFRQYDLLYNRPDKVLATLPGSNTGLIDAYHKAYLKRLQKMGFREEDLSAEAELPVLKVNTQNFPFETDKPQLDVPVDASDTKFLLNRVNVWVNDVPVYGRSGISLRGKNVHHWNETLHIPLSTGENKIQISCLNEKGVESLLEDITITCRAPKQKPDLYLLAIGVSEYANPQMNLNYAAKDASDVVALFQAQKEQFGNIHTRTLLNRDATAVRVQQLKSWLAGARTDDRVILFVSGHGLLDDNLDYFLATFDVDFANPKIRGIPYDALEDLLDGIPARQKLILMDACHSGELDKENVHLVQEQAITSAAVKFRSFDTRVENKQIGLQNSFELMKELFVDLRRNSGATVISSAGGGEYAIEGDTWKNGVFTYSLVKGLRDKEADLDKNGAVTISELQNYLGRKVADLTQGQQRPTFRAENIANDWQLW